MISDIYIYISQNHRNGEHMYLYMFILDKSAREYAASNHDEFTRMAYITLGITYFWNID